MIAIDEDALICDFAETYRVLDYRELTPEQAARLAAGLRNDSRIKLKIAGAARDEKTIMIASIHDAVNFLAWAKTKDASKGRNRPKSLVQFITSGEINKQSDVVAADSIDEFKVMRQKIINEVNHGN